jgi:hypothetical protein
MASLIASAIVTVIGAGISAYGQYQSGKSQQAIANFNAAEQERQAATQMQAMQVQAALQKQQADANYKLRASEAQARMNNALSLENNALGQDAINRANLVKRREEFERMQSTQRAEIARSGIVESTGTPLDLLAETAARIQQDQEEQHYQNELQRRTLFSEAAQERLGGKLALAGATLDRDSQVSAAALAEISAKSEFLGGMRQAEITRLTGAAAKQAATYQAAGTLFSGVGSAMGSYAQYNPPKTKTPKTSGTN